MRLAEITSHEGKLAQFRGAHVEQARPVHVTRLAVSDLSIDAYLEQFIGQAPWAPGGGSWSGEVTNRAGGRTYIEASDWREIMVETPVARPRDGREYGYVWDCGSWRKDYFPKCSTCGKYHHPAFVACEACDTCSKPGKHACEVN